MEKKKLYIFKNHNFIVPEVEGINNIDTEDIPHIDLTDLSVADFNVIKGKCFYDINYGDIFYPIRSSTPNCYYMSGNDDINNLRFISINENTREVTELGGIESLPDATRASIGNVLKLGENKKPRWSRSDEGNISIESMPHVDTSNLSVADYEHIKGRCFYATNKGAVLYPLYAYDSDDYLYFEIGSQKISFYNIWYDSEEETVGYDDDMNSFDETKIYEHHLVINTSPSSNASIIGQTELHISLYSSSRIPITTKALFDETCQGGVDYSVIRGQITDTNFSQYFPYSVQCNQVTSSYKNYTLFYIWYDTTDAKIKIDGAILYGFLTFTDTVTEL